MPTTEAEAGARRLVIAPGGHAIAGKATRGRMRAGAKAAHGMVARMARRRSVGMRCGLRCRPQSGRQLEEAAYIDATLFNWLGFTMRSTHVVLHNDANRRTPLLRPAYLCASRPERTFLPARLCCQMAHSVPRVVARRRQAAPSRARAAVAHCDSAKVRIAPCGARAQLALRRDAAQRDALPLPRHQLLWFVKPGVEPFVGSRRATLSARACPETKTGQKEKRPELCASRPWWAALNRPHTTFSRQYTSRVSSTPHQCSPSSTTR